MNNGLRAITATSLMSPPYQLRSVSSRSHSASKKRFKPRGTGGLVYKPAGRKHYMSHHNRNRNRSKGAARVISRNENGDLWRRLRSMNIKMRATSVAKPKAAQNTGTEVVYKFSDYISTNKGLMSAVATKVTADMAPSMTKKKVQWRTIG